MKEKIKELAAIYNTYGYKHGFSRMAEKVLVKNSAVAIKAARTLAAQSAHIV